MIAGRRSISNGLLSYSRSLSLSTHSICKAFQHERDSPVLMFSKVRSLIRDRTKTSSTCCRSLNSTLARPPNHRSYPLSIQWFSIWYPHTVSCPCMEKVNITPEWPALRGVIVLKAHIPIPCTGILCLSSTSILPGPEVHFPHKIF
jgi:hypothetical protein